MFSPLNLFSVSLIFLCGFIGGLALSLLQERGLEIPHWRMDVDKEDKEKNKRVWFFDMGFLGEALVGGFAAVISFGLSQPAEEWQVITSSLIAGLGGAGILKGFIEKGNSQEYEQIAKEAVNQTTAILAPKAKRSKRRSRRASPRNNLDEVRLEHVRSLTRRLAAVR